MNSSVEQNLFIKALLTFTTNFMLQGPIDEFLVESSLSSGLRKIAWDRLHVVDVAKEALGPRRRAVRILAPPAIIVLSDLTLDAFLGNKGRLKLTLIVKMMFFANRLTKV